MSMQEIATTEPSRAPAVPPTDKRVRIPKRVRHACELIASGSVTTITAAAERVGLSREHLSRSISKPEIQAFIARESSRTISTAQLRASRRFVELLEDESGHVAAKVADRILTSTGILKSDAHQVAVSVGVNVGYVLDLRDTQPHVTVIEHDVGKDVGKGADRSET